MPILQSIDVYQLPIALKKPFTIALESFTHAKNLVVQLTDEEGRTGWGECSPFPSINGETMETAFSLSKQISTQLLGKEALDFKVAMQTINSQLFGNYSLKSAFDIAFHDLVAQYRNQPLYEFWGPPQWSVLQTDYTVSLGSVAEMATTASWIKEQGFPAIKVKLGGTYAEDMARLHAIREVVGDEISLRLDANQGWDVTTATQILTALSDWNIDFCEAPINRRLYHLLPAISAAVPVPIMADESCFDAHDAERLLAAKACTYLNVKLGKAGGLTEARRILRVAEKYRAQVQIGGFLESRLGFTAAAHLALSSPTVKFIDMDTPLMFADDPVTGGISYSSNGMIELPVGNGGGAGIKPEFLEQAMGHYCVRG